MPTAGRSPRLPPASKHTHELLVKAVTVLQAGLASLTQPCSSAAAAAELDQRVKKAAALVQRYGMRPCRDNAVLSQLVGLLNMYTKWFLQESTPGLETQVATLATSWGGDNSNTSSSISGAPPPMAPAADPTSQLLDLVTSTAALQYGMVSCVQAYCTVLLMTREMGAATHKAIHCQLVDPEAGGSLV